MTEPRELLLEHPVAQRLADLAGVQHDLDLVIQACDRFLSGPKVGSEEAILVSRSLATFAIVTYCRTITSGVRTGIAQSDMSALPANLQNSHAKFKSIRDKFVAHSVNYSEENAVQIRLDCSDPSAVKIHTIGTTHSRDATFSSEEILDLKELSSALRAMMDAEYENELDRVWDFLGQLPSSELERILSAPPQPTYRPPNMPRKKFR